MISRRIAPELHQLLGEYPIVTVIGPRQSGKTTLVQMELTEFDYCNLESMDVRRLAIDDPRALLGRYPGPVIIDEIQRAPDLLSYIQTIVDEEKQNGRFVLTGSHQLLLHEAITQSLAGRTAILTLYPLSIEELSAAGIQFDSSYDYLFHGFLPRIHDQRQRPSQAYSNYYRTYVERDVRQLINLKDLTTFDRFIRLLAGRIGQLMDYSSLGNDVGVSPNTIKHWLSILEASFVIYRLSPYFENFGKRVLKSSKYYFVDVGLLSYLLDIRDPAQLSRDPLIGQIFENMVAIECLKSQTNDGLQSNLYFYRDSNSNEIDILIPNGRDLTAVEIKLSHTYSKHMLKGITRIRSITDRIVRSYLVYSGDQIALSQGITAIRYDEVNQIFT